MMRPARFAVVALLVLTATTCSNDNGGGRRASGEKRPRAPKVAAGNVTGPLTGGAHGFPQTSAVLDLRGAGYVEEEFVLRGNATGYRAASTWGSDGIWPVQKTTTAGYATRLLVRRPTDPKQFNGTVVVEWLNVTSGVDVDVDFGYLGPEIVRSGYAWVGVTAQQAAVESTEGSQFGPAAVGLKAWDPARYGELHHPGDAYSYDIFSRAGAAVRAAADNDLLGGLRPTRILADGESQSAFRMLTYVNAVHPVADVFDGFLIHSRGGTGSPLGDNAGTPVPAPARVRPDLDAPVFQLETETDLFGLRGDDPKPGTDFPSARQPDSNRIRTWEMAGTAHADADYLRQLSEQGKKQFESFLDLSKVIPTVNDGQKAEVMRAALHALNVWVRTGTPPPTAPPLQVAGETIVRDEHGNALGGVRTPAVDAPVAALSGEGGALVGSTKPFDTATLEALYSSHDAYVDAVERAARAGVRGRFLLSRDADAIVNEARRSSVGT